MPEYTVRQIIEIPGCFFLKEIKETSLPLSPTELHKILENSLFTLHNITKIRNLQMMYH